MAKGSKLSSKGKKEKPSTGKSKTDKDKSRIDGHDDEREGTALWDECIQAAVLNDGKWKCNVVFLFEKTFNDSKYIEWFEKGAKMGSRRVIRNISYADIILELKMSKGRKGVGIFHPLQGVCTAASKQLSGGKVPVGILAKVIKYKIIRLKEADLAAKRAKIIEEREIQRSMQRRKELHTHDRASERADGKGNKSKEKWKGKGSVKSEKGDKKEKGKSGSVKKGKRGKGDDSSECWEGSNLLPPETTEKWNTKVRKRGESGSDSYQIDDAPQDGADLYVILTGFLEPELLTEVIKLGVPVHTIVKLKSEHEDAISSENASQMTPKNVQSAEDTFSPDPPHRNASMYESPCANERNEPAGTRRKSLGSEAFDEKSTEILQFWTKIDAITNQEDNLHLIKDIALIAYPVPSDLRSTIIPEEIVYNQKTMYDLVSYIAYDMESVSRQHLNYVRNIKLVNLKSSQTINTVEGMDIYNTMVHLLPAECQTVAFIMHCIVEQVEMLCKEPEVMDILSPQDDEEKQKSTEAVFELNVPGKVSKSQDSGMVHKIGSKSASAIHARSEDKSTFGSKIPLKTQATSLKNIHVEEKIVPKIKSTREVSLVFTPNQTPSVEGVTEVRQHGSKVDLVQRTVEGRVSQLNKEYDLFQVPAERAVRRDPLVLIHRDEATIRSHHISPPEVDLAEITGNILKHSPPIVLLWNLFKEQTNEEKMKYDFHIHQLWNCMEGRKAPLHMLKNHLHLLLFEKMECTSVAELNKGSTTSVKRGASSFRKLGFMGFTNFVIPEMRKKVNSASFCLIRTPVSDPFMGKQSNVGLNTRERRMESIGEMLECSEIVCLTDPIKYVLTGFRSINQRASVLDLHKFTAVEEFNANVMLQNLKSAYSTYNCVDYNYYAPTDALLLSFHNCKDKTGLLNDKYMITLRTPVAFRDFCEYVYDEEANWLEKANQKYEKSLEEERDRMSRMTIELREHETKEVMTLATQLRTGEAENAFIKIGSLKHDDIMKKLKDDGSEHSKPDEKKAKGKGKGSDKSDKKKKSSKDSKAKESNSKEKKESKEKKGKENKSDVDNSKVAKKSKDELENEVEIPFVKRPSMRCAKEGEHFSFHGFDLSPLRYQIDGNDSWFFSPDGTEIKVKVKQRLYRSEKEITTTLKKRGHSLYIHSKTVDEAPQLASPFGFHVASSFGTILAFEERLIVRPPTTPPAAPAADIEIIVEPPSSPSSRTQSPKVGASAKSFKEKSGVSYKRESTTSLKGDKLESTTKFRLKSRQSGSFTLETPIPIPPPPPPFPTPIKPSIEEIPWKYNFRASWPSGLSIKTIVGTSERDPFRIKQKYLQKGPKCEQIRHEDFRIMLRNGTILKFLQNDFVEVLSHDSTITLCKAFRRPDPLVDSFTYLPRNSKVVDCPEDVWISGQELRSGKSIKDIEASRSNQRRTSVAQPAILPDLELVSYHVITPLGKEYSVEENVLNENYETLLLRVATDYEFGEVFTRRSDGTNTLLMQNGTLIVVFPDGSRITSSFAVDDEPVFLEWSEEEMMEVTQQIAQREDEEERAKEEAQRLEEEPSTGQENGRRESSGSGGIRRESVGGKETDSHVNIIKKRRHSSPRKSSGTNVRRGSKSNSKTSVEIGEKNEGRSSVVTINSVEDHRTIVVDFAMFVDEGFVSVHMDCCLEHPNYATVSYRGREKNGVIDMPHEMSIQVSPYGLYSANIDSRTELEIGENTIHYNCFVCQHCQTSNKSTLQLSGFNPPSPGLPALDANPVFCKTTDSWGHTHVVDHLGEAKILSFTNTDDTEFNDEVEITSSVGHEKSVCLPQNKCNQRRCFVVKRDLSGQEFIHCEDAKQFMQNARDTPGASVVEAEVPGNSGFKYHTILSPLLQTESEKWLMEYKSKYILPHQMRKKHLRSTYGDPPGWFHPFPRLGKAFDRRTGGTAEKRQKGAGGELPPLSEVYILRVLQDMEFPGLNENIIAAMHDGLIKYWDSATRNFQEYMEHTAEDPRNEEEILIEDYLLGEAIRQGVVNVPEMMRRGQRGLGPTFGAMEKLQRKMSAHSAYLENVFHKKIEEDLDRETYKAILRNQAIPPYFQTISGESFLKVLSSVNTAISEAEEKEVEEEQRKREWDERGRREGEVPSGRQMLVEKDEVWGEGSDVGTMTEVVAKERNSVDTDNTTE